MPDTICCLLQLPSKLHWHRPARPRRLNNYRTAAIFDPSCASRTLQHICYIAACTAHRVASSDCHNRVSRYAQGSSNQHFDVIATDGTLCCNCVTQICYRHVGRQKKRQTTAHAIGGQSQLRMLVLAAGFGTPFAQNNSILWRVN
jgi:hypothetical protein